MKTLALEFPEEVATVTATLDGEAVSASLKTFDGKRHAVFDQEVELGPGLVLVVRT